MKAAVVRRFKEPLAIEDVPKPEPGEGEVLVKIEACGLCRTDIHAAHGDWPVKSSTRNAGGGRCLEWINARPPAMLWLVREVQGGCDPRWDTTRNKP